MQLKIFERLRGVFAGIGRALGRTPADAASYAFGTATGAMMTPLFRDWSYRINAQLPTERLTVSDIVNAFTKGYISLDRAQAELRELGFNDERTGILVKLGERLLTLAEVSSLWLRGEIDEAEHDKRLLALGLSKEDISLQKKLYFYIPGVADLVRMAVREVFAPAVREKFGLDQDFPAEFAKYAKMQGVSEEWAKAFWAAHWELPSLTMGYEMFHRGIISEEELRMLMRAQDVMPWWRDKLIKLSYRPLTRVDVRRMYQMGVLDRMEVYQAYLNLGYSPADAERMTDFTISFASERERDLTRSDILRGYRVGLLKKEEAIEKLKLMGYDDDEAEYLVISEDYKRIQEEKDELLRLLKAEYQAGVKAENEVREELTTRDFTAEEIEYHLRLWDTARVIKDKKPSVKELLTFYKAKVIDEATLKSELAFLGLAERYVNWYLALIKKGEEV